MGGLGFRVQVQGIRAVKKPNGQEHGRRIENWIHMGNRLSTPPVPPGFVERFW